MSFHGTKTSILWKKRRITGWVRGEFTWDLHGIPTGWVGIQGGVVGKGKWGESGRG